MNVAAFVLTMCVLHPSGYCADVIQERYTSMPACMAIAEQYRDDKRVIVYCAGVAPARNEAHRAPKVPKR